MSKVLSALAVIALAACAPKEEAAPVAEEPVMAAPVVADTVAPAAADTMMVRDTAKAP